MEMPFSRIQFMKINGLYWLRLKPKVLKGTMSYCGCIPRNIFRDLALSIEMSNIFLKT